MNPFHNKLVDPLSSSGPIPLAWYRMRWQREVDRCIITIALMWWLSVRETPTEVIVFLYTFQSYVVSLHTHRFDIMFLNSLFLYIALVLNCFILKWVQSYLVKYSNLSIQSWVSRVKYPESNIISLSRISYPWVEYLISELSILSLSTSELSKFE